MNYKTSVTKEALAIRDENEVIPESLKLYIQNELNRKIKEACKSEYCTIMCDGEIGILVSRINNSLKLIRRMVLNNISEGLDENGNMMKQENEDAIKRYIERIISRIWNTEEIVRLIMQFFKAVRYWKKQSLPREADEPEKMDSEELENLLKNIEAEAQRKVEKIGEVEKEKIKIRLLDAYERYKKIHDRELRIKENKNRPNGRETGENDSDDRDEL